MKSLFIAGAAASMFLFAGNSLGQAGACPAGAPVASYRVSPIANAYATIVGDPNTTTLFGFALPPLDDASVAVPLPAGFPFAFYGVPRTAMNVCTNGFVDFAAAGQPSFTNEQPGDGAAPNDCAMPWHDDLVLPTAGSKVAWNAGFYGPQTLVVEWRNVGTFTGSTVPTSLFSFQCVLHASDHPTWPDAIEFRYDRTSAPPTLVPCFAWSPSTQAVSATIGTDGPSPQDAANAGVDAAERGAANSKFPPSDLRLTPASFAGSEQDASFTASLLTQEPYCSIAGLPGTVAVASPCLGPDCYADDNSAQVSGVQIALPWKFNLAGRPVRHANMNSNGYLQLGEGTFSPGSANALLPGPAEPDGVLAPFWDDLAGAGGASGMFGRVDGPAGCRIATFEWKHFTRHLWPGGNCAGGPGIVSFQVKLFEGGAGAPSSATGSCPYGLVQPGIGEDRVEFHYDHAGFAPGPFAATIGFENHKGTLGGTFVAGVANAAPPAGMKCVLVPCAAGTVRTFGEANRNHPAGCFPEFRTNGVPPRIGNPLELQVVGASPAAAAVLVLRLDSLAPGGSIPVPCGGIASPFGTFWVDPLGPLTLLVLTATAPGGPCSGSAAVPMQIPNDSTLVGAVASAQWAVVQALPVGLGVEWTEAARVTVGG